MKKLAWLLMIWCPPMAVFPLSRFVLANQQFSGTRTNHFDKTINIALENTSNLIGTKFRAHRCLFTALGTIVSRKFGHWPISQEVRGNTDLWIYTIISNSMEYHV